MAYKFLTPIKKTFYFNNYSNLEKLTFCHTYLLVSDVPGKALEGFESTSEFGRVSRDLDSAESTSNHVYQNRFPSVKFALKLMKAVVRLE